MTFTSMIKKISNPVNGSATLESVMVSSLGAFYTPNSFQITKIQNHTESTVSCVIGNYIDTEANLPTPFIAVNTANEGVSDATWVVTGFRNSMDMAVALLNEQAGLFSMAEIPSTSTNWTQGWVAVGHVYVGGGVNLQNMCPLIVYVGLDGVVTTYSSQVLGINPPKAWLLTHFGGLRPNVNSSMLCDVVYDAQNDSLVACGGASNETTGTRSYSMWVELIDSANPPTFMMNVNHGFSDDLALPAFMRSCAIQTQDASGNTVANRTIISTVGFANQTAGTWALYQPNFSNPWGGNPRNSWIDKGTGQPAEFFAQQGLAASDTPTYLTLCERITADGEDIYFVGGIASGGIFAYGLSGLQTDSTGGGADNIINNAGVATQLIISELNNKIAPFRSNTAGTYSATTSTSAITDVLGIGSGSIGRRTKLYAAGYVVNGRNAPTDTSSMGGTESVIFAVSRGFNLFRNEITLDGLNKGLFTASANQIKMALFNNSTTTKVSFANASFDPTGVGISSQAYDFSATTGHAAFAWFEYLLYDGVDSLIARKLDEMGVRVTIANVEWYKQDVLKRGFDVSTDFFNEWAELQVGQNEERERVAEQFGKKRPPKRQTRTELFDDYADYESKTEAVETFPDYDPNKDGDPFKDDVALTQEVEKTQKAVDDLRRIEDLVDDETNDESEYDGASDVSDYGDD
jgi:hypothetical protein